MISNFAHHPKTLEQWSKKYFISDNEMKENLKLLDAKITLNEALVYFDKDLSHWKKQILSYIKEKCSIDSFHNYVEVNNIVQSFRISDKWAKLILDNLVNSNDIFLKSGKILLVNRSFDISNKIKLEMKNITALIKNADSEILSIKQIISLSKMNPKKVKELIFLLKDEGKIIQVNDSLIINNDAFNKLLISVRKYFKKYSKLSVSEFKNLSSLTRKNAIPILEYFDNSNITQRVGSYRKAGDLLFGK